MDYQGSRDGSPPPFASPSLRWYTSPSRTSSANTYQPDYGRASEEQPPYMNQAQRYGRCGSCGRTDCSCFGPSVLDAGHGVRAAQMDGDLTNVCPRPLRYWEPGWEASQVADDFVESRFYGGTERPTGYPQNEFDTTVQDASLDQYSNTSRVILQSQNDPLPTQEGSSLVTPCFNANSRSDFTTTQEDTATQEDHEMIDPSNDYDDSNTVEGPEQQYSGVTLSDLEARYQPHQCLLEGCRKGYVFESFHSFRSHIKNVHSKEIWCEYPSCTHPRPFANKTDLGRHHRSKHGDKSFKPFKCLRRDCPARVKEFNRKDKLKEHHRKYHAQYSCFFCPQWFESFDACAEHTNNRHVLFANS